MKRTAIRMVGEKVGESIVVSGFWRAKRDQSKVKFARLTDWTGSIQLVVTPEQEKLFNAWSAIPLESVVEVKGTVKAEKQAPEGFEIHVQDLKLISKAESSLPIPVEEKGVETALNKRLDWRCLDLRKAKSQAAIRVQSAIVEGMLSYLLSEGFIQVFTPCLMGTPSESGSEMFEVKYFQQKAYLRQDPQLHRQLTIAGGFEKIVDIGPSWRAEQSHTTKHLCEHRTCAVEFSYIQDERDTMRLEEQVIVSALSNVKKKCEKELAEWGVEITIPKTPFVELTFPEIYDILEKEGKLIRGQDLDAEAEKILWEHVKKTHGQEFYFINHFPSTIKPFYVMKMDEDPTYARSVDLNWKGLELSSGGQRENRYDILMQQVKEKGVRPESVEWFTQFFRFGVPNHGGFAIGIERMTKMILGMENIREVVLFPRGPERLTP